MIPQIVDGDVREAASRKHRPGLLKCLLAVRRLAGQSGAAVNGWGGETGLRMRHVECSACYTWK